MMAASKGTPAFGVGIEPNLRRSLEKIAEVQDTGAGLRGDPIDRYIRVADLIDMGLAKRLSNRAQALVSGVNLVSTLAPILDIPPQPQNFEVIGGLGIIFLSWDSARAAYGNHSYTSVYRAEVDNLSVAVEVAQAGDSFGFIEATAVYGTTYYYWVRFVSGDGISGPWNAALGTVGKLAEDPAILLAMLTGEITESQLYADLNSRINLIDLPTTGLVAQSITNANNIISEINERAALAAQLRGTYTGTDPAGLSSGLLKSERTERIGSISALSTQMALLTAGSNSQFDQSNIWYFDTNVEGWTGNGAPTVPTAGWIRPSSHATDAYITSPTITVDGTKYPQVRARIKKTGSPTWEGYCYYITSADGTYNTTKRIAIAEPTYDAGVGLITWNMEGAWNGSTITQIRIDLATAQDASNNFEIDWVAIGRPSPGASAAEVFTEQMARVAADAVNASDILSLTTTVNGKASSSALSALDTRVTTAESTVTSHSSQISALNTSVAGKASSAAVAALDSRVTSTEGSIATQSSQITALNGAVAGVASGAALSALDTRVTATEAAASSTSSQITTLNNSVAGKASSASVASIDSRVTSAEGTIASQSTQITSLNNSLADKASSGAVSSLDSRVGAVEGVNTAQATAITNVTTTVNGQTATVQAQQTAINGISAQYMVKTDVNGLVSGFGLYNDGATSQFGISVDRFYVGAPGKGSFSLIVENGKVVMDGASIKDLTVTTLKIGTAVITAAKIASGQINDLHVGTLAVDTINGDVSAVYPFSTTAGIDFSGSIQVAVGTIVVPSRTRAQGLSVWVNGVASKSGTGGGYVKAEFFEPGPGGPVLTNVSSADSNLTGTALLWSKTAVAATIPSDWAIIGAGDLIRIYYNVSNFVEGIVSNIQTAGGSAGGGQAYVSKTVYLTLVYKIGVVPANLVGASIYRLAAASRLYKPLSMTCVSSVSTSGLSTYNMSFYDTNSRLAISRNILCTIGFYPDSGATTFVNTQLNIAVVAGR